MVKAAQALEVQPVGQFGDRFAGVGQQPGGVVDPQFVDEFGRGAVEVLAEHFAQIFRGVAGELLHPFEAGNEILRGFHLFAQTFQPLRRVGGARRGLLRQEEPGEKLRQQYLETDFADRRSDSLRIQAQQLQGKLVHPAFRHPEYGGEHAFGIAVQEGVVLKVAADRHEEFQVKGEQQQFAVGRSGGGQETVAVVGAHEDHAVRLQQLFFPVDAVDDRAGEQEDQLPELVGVFNGPAGGQRMVVQIAAAGDGGLLTPCVPADCVKRHLRADRGIDEIVQFQCDCSHVD